MTEIQRWAPFDPMALMGRHPNGAFVTYADHVAAVAAAEQRAGEEAHGHYMDGYNKAWSLSAAEIERQVREEEQAAQTLARAELYSMEEMDERCTQAADEAFAAGVKAAREAVEAENKNPISRVTTDYDIGYRDGTNDTVRLHLRAIDALLKEKS